MTRGRSAPGIDIGKNVASTPTKQNNVSTNEVSGNDQPKFTIASILKDHEDRISKEEKLASGLAILPDKDADDDNDDDDTTIPVATIVNKSAAHSFKTAEDQSGEEDNVTMEKPPGPYKTAEDDDYVTAGEDDEVIPESDDEEEEEYHEGREGDDDHSTDHGEIDVAADDNNDNDDDDGGDDIGKGVNGLMSDFNEFLTNDDNFDNFDDTDYYKEATGLSSRLIKGGPDKPDTTGMSVSRTAAVLRQYRIDRKKYTDKLRSDRLRESGSAIDAAIEYSGDQSPLLRMLEVVKMKPTEVGHSFPTQKLAQL